MSCMIFEEYDEYKVVLLPKAIIVHAINIYNTKSVKEQNKPNEFPAEQ